ncbi:hypothetical protein M634_02530 [Vibrio parahaemolyticus O1:Kuk str. FDA_R31]|nr:hypothetical protein M634_02530 [Vibrio parahaemolyticus O1:Kuk str. FDA_R31]AGR00368.1 hypothetical protein M636_21265 [Vibrio parahaemolyticus O1:K33 str. CDC_K4557]ANB98452.1 hypothetical protein FORC14_0189 [Vibrio parahaemolyticus]EGF42532.1 hypothetical protein VP10329_00830 [Vibrio parahaemolyticus 10329]ETZ08375.1 hypothetical protein AJ90_01290 [Vibrio parahaemolyticus M0605]KIS85065.1 hypothetical protein H321_10970 [Vibrio parahaemolyticus 97-10290]KIS90410.1 hypothetical protei
MEIVEKKKATQLGRLAEVVKPVPYHGSLTKKL